MFHRFLSTFARAAFLALAAAFLALAGVLCLAGTGPRAAPIPNGCGTERLDAMVGS